MAKTVSRQHPGGGEGEYKIKRIPHENCGFYNLVTFDRDIGLEKATDFFVGLYSRVAYKYNVPSFFDDELEVVEPTNDDSIDVTFRDAKEFSVNRVEHQENTFEMEFETRCFLPHFERMQLKDELQVIFGEQQK